MYIASFTAITTYHVARATDASINRRDVSRDRIISFFGPAP